MRDELGRLREEIDALDAEVLRLLAERFRRVVGIACEKVRLELPIEDRAREVRLARAYAAAAATHGLEPRVAEALFAMLLEESKRHQRETIARLEAGSASEIVEKPSAE